ncbi:5'-nucleotidase [Propionivibrio dicarboxylicus]|uniref:5'-nucleotidase n=1 Tax=Propionivibrio dicarboxylicus TaxID=83767 RepID=A0A1G8KA55_9RHOO|nr:5'-nucleotidase [Propionivibrio dicarboxylicus]
MRSNGTLFRAAERDDMRWWRKRCGVVLSLLWALSLLVGCANEGAPRPASTVTVSLVGFNDFHGQLLPGNGSVPVARDGTDAVERVPAGGAAYLAALIKRLRAENPDNTLVVAAGDLIGASPLVSSLFHDEPTIEVLNRIGISVSSVGNHEFEKGRNELFRLQRGGCHPVSADGTQGVVGRDTCMTDGRFEGAKFTYLGANVIDRQSGRPLLPAYAVREIGGVRIGFVGVTLRETPATMPRKLVEGLDFADEVATINALVPTLLHDERVAFVVALLHQGGETTARAINDTACPGFSGAVLRIVDRLDPAVQVVMTGHTHEEYVCTRPDGRLMTQAGNYGRMATKIDLVVEPGSGRVLAKSARTHVAANRGAVKDDDVDGMVGRYAALTAERAQAIVGHLAAPLSRAANRTGERPLGNVLADAYLFGGQAGVPADQAAQIAFVNPGGIRAELSGDPVRGLDVSFGQLYAVHPFGNTLPTLSMTGEQLRRVLEQQWESPQPPSGNVLAVSAGFTYAWDAAQPIGAAPGQGRRVVPGSMRLHGVPIDPTVNYRVTVNSFLAHGGDNFSVFSEAATLAESERDLDVLMAYFRAQGVVQAPALDRIGRRN